MGADTSTCDAFLQLGTTYGEVTDGWVACTRCREACDGGKGEDATLGPCPPGVVEALLVSEAAPGERVLVVWGAGLALGVVTGEWLGLLRGEKTLNDAEALVR